MSRTIWDRFGNPVSKNRLPYGVMSADMMTFVKCVHNPKSRLARIVNYIRENGPTDRKTFLREVFGVTRNPRGWGAMAISGFLKANFLTKTRVGNTVLYGLGINSIDVV